MLRCAAVRAVEIDVRRNAFRASQTRCVDRHERLAIQLEAHVDAVSGRAGHLADDHPLGLGQRVDERTLARVAPADDRDLHRLQLGRRLLLAFGGEPFQDQVQQFVPSTVLGRAGAHDASATQPVKLVGLGVHAHRVGLVGDAQYGDVQVAQPLRDLLIQRHDASPGIDHEQHHTRRFQGRGDLLLDVGREIVRVFDAHAAGVDQLEVAVVQAHQVRHAVARHAGRVIDNREPLADEPIEEARFADIGPADDDNLWYSHDAA